MAMNLPKEAQLAMAQRRLDLLKNRGDKNFKCPGVVRKLSRQIRNLERELAS
jgi:hypothetical protein